MESGALNGRTYSNTHFFEYFAKWKAIHVEASLKNYNELIEYRKDSFANIYAALCSENRDVHVIGAGGPTSGKHKL